MRQRTDNDALMRLISHIFSDLINLMLGRGRRSAKRGNYRDFIRRYQSNSVAARSELIVDKEFPWQITLISFM